MAQDVCSKMAEDPFVLKEDGYLNAATEIKKIVYHPSLNVILICINSGIVRVLDVNSGVVLQASYLSTQDGSEVTCLYIPGQDRVLFCDGYSIGVRSDYNGVLLLDTILQKTINNTSDNVKLELLLSEAIILKQSLSTIGVVGVDQILNELTEKILDAQKQSKKGIKAQKWNTVCLNLPFDTLKTTVNCTVTESIGKKQHSPELGVASAVYERLSELVGEQANASDRRAMASEAKRRETFNQWPHMDYKWALPDQMAQAGFYHLPNAAGDDRAMCFTCSLCLVCWERTDEPWSEHERHSPTCPFIMGEYTQNVPVSVTFATNPAIDATYRGVAVQTIGTSSVSHLIATANKEGLISVFDVSGKLKRTHSFFVTQFDSHILDKLTQDFGVPGTWSDIDEVKCPAEKQITALTIVGEKCQTKSNSTAKNGIRPTIICGLSVRCHSSSKNIHHKSSFVETLNDQNKSDQSSINIMEIDELPASSEMCSLYLVVYDFQYTKEPQETKKDSVLKGDELSNKRNDITPSQDYKDYISISMLDDTDGSINDTNMDVASSHSDDCMFFSDVEVKAYTILKQQMSMYQNLIPGESDEIFLPPSIAPTKQHSLRRVVLPDVTETDAAQATSLILPPDYSFMNGQLSSSPVETATVNEKSISDHIAELKNSKANKKLNYSRAEQCISLPKPYKNRRDLEVTDIVPTPDGGHILVVLGGSFHSLNSVLLMYSLNFSHKMVKVNEEPVLVRELNSFEKPVEVSLLPVLEHLNESMEFKHESCACEGSAVLVCEDGAVRIIDLSTLKTVSVARLEGTKFISAVYCNSLERLCASTSSGSLHFYALNDVDNDSVEDQEDEDLFSASMEQPPKVQLSDITEANENRYFYEPVQRINISDLKHLQTLCEFEPLKVGYCAVVPPCWSEMQQAQRQRRHPYLQVNSEQHTKMFRLQTDTTTWDEHIFELTLPSPACIGHVDVHFSLHTSSASPHVEITLLKQNTYSIGHKRDFKFSVDDSVTCDSLQWVDNPVTSHEYLQSQNVDILAGPVDIVSCLDLTEQSGCVTLTSPKLFKSRIRTLLLHIKSVCSKENSKSKLPNLKCKRSESRTPGVTLDKYSQTGTHKTEFYMGCDCLHEVSITIHSIKHTDIPHERNQRASMLESNIFVQSLCLTASLQPSLEQQNITLDILIWVAAIRLTRNRSNNGQAPNQQLEFLKIIEANLTALLRFCLLLANRSMAHKCVKLMILCSNGAKDISEQIGKRFDLSVLNVLMNILDSVDQVNSAASLQWLVNLLLKVMQPDQMANVAAKCISLLGNVSHELNRRTNPYHLLLRSRYGLFGTPLEPELFDIEPPPPIKPSSIAVTYATVVAGENVTQPFDFHTNYAFNKETLDPKEVLSVTKGDGKIKLKNIAPSKLVRGLLETEPLHFTCASASEGTRIERADVSGSSFVNNLIPITVSVPQTQTTGTKKVEGEHHYPDFTEVYQNHVGKSVGNGQGSSNNSYTSLMDGAYQVIFQTDNVKTEDFSKLIADSLEISVDSDSGSMHSEPQSKSAFTADKILSPNQSLPWQQLLVAPPQQVIVVERMHSGARRFVTLDFGQPVLLTDVLIPACHELVSISLDLWIKSEDVDATRLVTASDISTRNLVFNDLQPPPLCRYLKITAVGRYGMTTTRCRIPVGYFYGHLIVLPEEVSYDQMHSSVAITTDLENQLNVLSMLLEDVNCRYSLACSKLKELLHPFLTSSITNASHLSAYMNIMKESVSNMTTCENAKVFTAYQEAITYQRQLNTVRNVMRRIECGLNTSEAPIDTLSDVCVDKLRCIVESLLDALLSIDTMSVINLESCHKLFQGLCVSQGSRIQFLTATVLVRSCGKQPYWGTFLAETLREMYSSSYNSKFPQDRVFVLLAFLGRKSLDRSSVLDATLKVIAQVLQPLALNRQSLLAVSIDLPLLGWLLLFLSLQLDISKVSLQNATRWDWVTGEMAGKSIENMGSYKKKLQKRVLYYKQQAENLDWTHKVVQTSTQVQALASLSTQAASLTSKVEATLKQHQEHYKKSKSFKSYNKDCTKSVGIIESNDTSKQGKRRRETSESLSGRQSSIATVQSLDPIHCLAVAKGLLALLLAMDHSCSADMFLLSCKVIGRLVCVVKLQLGQLMNEEQLLRLIHICMGSELPWAPHALACLLQDIVEVGKPPNSDVEMETDSSPASTSWGTKDLLTDLEILCDSFALEDNVLSEPATKQGKTTGSNNPNSHLPSVFESDDSELEDFLDDILERKSHAKKSSRNFHPNFASSSAMDSRLEMGVEELAEIALRRLVTVNSYNLMQNVNATQSYVDNEQELLPWPANLVAPWNVDAQVAVPNRTMLVSCFNSLFKELQLQSSINIEHILQLWLTLNCVHCDDKFDPSAYPFIGLDPDVVSSLITTIAWSSGLSLRTWCSALQTLTMVCNMLQPGNNSSANTSQWTDSLGLYAPTLCIINHPDFAQLLLRLLSGTGLVFSEKGLGGPSLCKALHDLLVRLQMRCDVVSPTSKPGSQLKSLLLRVVYQLVQPTGPLAAKQGPLDAQCKLLQCMSYLDFCNADISIAMSIFECTGVLVHSYISQVDRIKCVNIGERLHPTSHLFSGIFASVLGSEPHKQDRPVSWDVLLVSLLKLLAKLVQTPLPSVNEQSEAMDTKPYRTAQTDESKAEQIQQERNIPPVPCLADTVLQHHPSIIRLCQSLAACKASSLSMLANISQQSTFADLGEPGTVGDAVFHTLAALARKTSRKELIMEPLLMFLSQAPQLSEPLLWFILQVLDTEEALSGFLNAGGIGILGRSLVHSSNAPNTVSHAGTVSMVMQHFGGSTTRSDASTAIASASSTKKMQQANLENNMSLINFAPFGSIKCQSSSAQSADVLIQGSAAAHRRARTAQWSYHFYPEEVHTELILQLPSAVLLREVHLQPHLGSLATCPSAVALEVSSDGPSRLVPACPPLPTSGMTFIRLHLPVPEVVNCIQLRLYKPRDANNIGLSQIRILGTSAFGGANKQQVLDLTEDEFHCKYSLGWLRLLHHCFTLPVDIELKTQIVENATRVPDLLLVCCGLLLVPTHIPGLYLPNLEKVLCELSLHNRENGLHVIEMLLESRLCVGEQIDNGLGAAKSPLFLHSAGVQSACELLYQICGHQDSDTLHRIVMLLQWLKSIAHTSIQLQNTDLCNPAYVSCIASILWTANQSRDSCNLGSVIDLELFHTIYALNTATKNNVALKHSLDCLLCSLCYIKIELFSSLLQVMGVLVPNVLTGHNASISDDLKDSESMTDDTKQTFENESEWYGRLVVGEIHELELSNEQLETIALVSRSPNAIQQLLDSGLPKKLTNAILEFCNNNSETSVYSISKLENVTAVLKFFSDISDEKVMRDWLGSKDGSSFWLPLLQWLCKRPCTKRSNLKSEVHTQLEEICVRFLTKCCLCHSNNQALLAKILCEVISQQRNGISGFMRRLILQLLLENEKVPVSINADETIYKNSAISYSYLPLHPAFKQTHNQALLYLGTNTLLADIIEQHISFSTTVEIDNSGSAKKEVNFKVEPMKGWWGITIDSDLSMAAGVTAKDKRAKDAKNLAASTPQLKKKRYTATENTSSTEIIEGRIIKCAAVSDQPLPVALSLGQVLRLIESKGMKTDWPCIHLVISQSKGSEDKNAKSEINPIIYQRSFSSALQVFTSVGGLALLAQHLPAVYPETVRTSPTEKSSSEQSESDWVKVEAASDDIYEDAEETSGSTTPSKTAGLIPNVPTHSLTAFGLFLRLPGYAEMLLKDMKKASCLLRLVLGVTDDGEGGDIFQSTLADSLPTLPFEVLRQLYDSTPLSTDDGRLLRRISINTGVVHLILACLGIFTHQTQTGNDKDLSKDKDATLKDERTQLYWAKGTGFGTGSTQQSWNVEQALLKQRSEEEHVTVLLQVLASYINPKGEAGDELADSVLPTIFYHLLSNSALLPALSSYLRNDSVLDMARHIPLYRAALQLLRALALSSQLVSLLLPQKVHNSGPSVGSLLKNMKTCVDTYASKLRFGNKPAKTVIKPKLGEQLEELERDEGLAQLMPDIQSTANLVKEVTDRLEDTEQDMLRETNMDYPLSSSVEQRYLSFMKHLQFDTFEMIQELPEGGGYKFVISHHFENNARSAGDQSHPARVKRLAQEAVTLATSLPLSYSSSVFVRCDTDRLDIMKVLITGPADTPYANGCFELDVYFPPEYPLSPMHINLETTGHRTVRFNPNLYNDGKVCLSVLNTWHGRPEEKWNTQTSSFLQVLVSIQSLILVPEPYFNEPGYERSRGTAAGTQSSREYNQNIWQATVRWAMLEQIINPCPCFKDVIHAHFYLKRHEIISQIEEWIKDIENHFAEKRLALNNSKRSTFTNLESFKKVFDQLRDKLMQLKSPEGLDSEGAMASSDAVENGAHVDTNASVTSEQQDIDADVDMEKMVDDMCE
ncbi:hypothetical protein PPYR_00362 [Photinus pyralis]|uniref:Dual E2 ubiquitin-conjugating enzyme/E3 ubiquitin-protein ligase BIRC6 n=1 Tax=Photinus pyralis TaxID=7054 RepID=A0A5N4B1B9_PHOPY|nr:baculoviral IAP repeat-containing protein 6 [Photinus pyralis]KAB0803392.1 hypothetical protein PPYR_00362 [Photinus pyralis]